MNLPVPYYKFYILVPKSPEATENVLTLEKLLGVARLLKTKSCPKSCKLLKHNKLMNAMANQAPPILRWKVRPANLNASAQPHLIILDKKNGLLKMLLAAAHGADFNCLKTKTNVISLKITPGINNKMKKIRIET